MKKLTAENKIINALGFQAIWWGVALYQSAAIPYAASLIVLHFVFLTSPMMSELKFVLFVGFAGIAIDTALLNIGFFRFEDPIFLGVTIIPFWLMILWFGFACTLNHCLEWIFSKKLFSFIIGGFGGALSYLAAVNLGAMEFSFSKAIAVTTLVIIWGLYFIFLGYIKPKMLHKSV